MQILFADDDPKLHIIVSLWLRRQGHTIVSAKNGRSAYERLQEGVFDGLITDVNMPLMNGLELAELALGLSAGPAFVIILTSRCDVADLRKRFDDERVTIFSKPFSPSVLTELIDEVGVLSSEA